MAVHLKYGTGDSLLYGPNGHMVYDCGTACNACDPALPETLCVVLSGLAGDFADLNGLHELPFVTGCHWVVEYGDAWVSLTFTGGHWEGSVGADTDCSIHFAAADGDDCAPWDAAFAYSSCTVTACTDADSCTDSASAVFQAVECPDNTCNSCDPPLPDTMYVTYAGLAGDFAVWNGKHTIVWQDSTKAVTAHSTACWWGSGTCGAGNGRVELGYNTSINCWTVFLYPPDTVAVGCGACMIRFDGAAGTCDVTDAYAQGYCTAVRCTDTDSCTDSAGATCVVSYT